MFIYQFVDPDQGVECSLKKAGKRTGGYDFKIGDSDNYCILVFENTNCDIKYCDQ